MCVRFYASSVSVSWLKCTFAFYLEISIWFCSIRTDWWLWLTLPALRHSADVSYRMPGHRTTLCRRWLVCLRHCQWSLLISSPMALIRRCAYVNVLSSWAAHYYHRTTENCLSTFVKSVRTIYVKTATVCMRCDKLSFSFRHLQSYTNTNTHTRAHTGTEFIALQLNSIKKRTIDPTLTRMQLKSPQLRTNGQPEKEKQFFSNLCFYPVRFNIIRTHWNWIFGYEKKRNKSTLARRRKNRIKPIR